MKRSIRPIFPSLPMLCATLLLALPVPGAVADEMIEEEIIVHRHLPRHFVDGGAAQRHGARQRVGRQPGRSSRRGAARPRAQRQLVQRRLQKPLPAGARHRGLGTVQRAQILPLRGPDHRRSRGRQRRQCRHPVRRGAGGSAARPPRHPVRRQRTCRAGQHPHQRAHR